MADPRTRRESGNRTLMLTEINSMLESMGVLEDILRQHNEESAPRIGDEFSNCVMILKYRFDRFLFRLKSMLPAHAISLGLDDVIQREVHDLLRRVNNLERIVEYPSRGESQQTRRVRQRR